jgi:hypothetical protein
LLRVPSRALFVSGFCFAAAGSHSYQHLSLSEYYDKKKTINYVLVGLNGLTLTLAGGIFYLDRTNSNNFIYGALVILIASIFILGRLSNKISNNLTFSVLIVILLIDLGIVGQSVYELRSKKVVISDAKQIANFLSDQDGLFRVYSPSYSVPQHVSVVNNLELVDGVDPLQLKAYSDYLVNASGVPSTGYSVTIPPFGTGDPYHDNKDFVPDALLLGLLNTRFIVSEYPLKTEALELQRTYGQSRIYINKFYLPRAWVQSPDLPIGSDVEPVAIVHKSPNQVEIEATGPGLLVLSEINYPGWKVSINGMGSNLLTINKILMGVEIPEGENRVDFYFRPKSLVHGGVAFGIGVVVVILFWFSTKRRQVWD